MDGGRSYVYWRSSMALGMGAGRPVGYRPDRLVSHLQPIKLVTLLQHGVTIIAMTSLAPSASTPPHGKRVLGALSRGLDALSGPPSSAPPSQNPYLTPARLGGASVPKARTTGERG
jgi:hypothetical protein